MCFRQGAHAMRLTCQTLLGAMRHSLALFHAQHLQHILTIQYTQKKDKGHQAYIASLLAYTELYTLALL